MVFCANLGDFPTSIRTVIFSTWISPQILDHISKWFIDTFYSFLTSNLDPPLSQDMCQVIHSLFFAIEEKNYVTSWEYPHVQHWRRTDSACLRSGYAAYFFLTPFASCQGWRCWRHVCGFCLLGIPIKHIHACRPTHKYTYMSTCRHTLMHTMHRQTYYIHTYIPAYTDTCKQTYILPHLHTYQHAGMYAYLSTDMQKCTGTCSTYTEVWFI